MIAAALVITGATGFLVKGAIDRPGSDQAARRDKIELVEVLVALRALPPGTVITGEDVAFRPWPKASLAPDYVVRQASPRKPPEVVGRKLARGYHQGEPIRAADLYKAE